MVTFNSNSLAKLCSQDQLELLDAIDRLRLQGISSYVSLPQIIVCGDQSSGKSSVLEAISGYSFPVNGNLCTRFPTELVLRRTPNISATVSIVPHQGRNETERDSLRGFKEKLDSPADLPDLIEKSKLAMGITTHGKAFSKDILRVEITGPDHPHLTIVDLPGLIHSATKHQSAADVELIQEVVQGYMKEPRCIILAVVSAKNDFANQIVLKLARKLDSSGTRTLGVITKPDDLIPGSNREALYLSLARNQEIEFQLGWHVVKNMDSDKGEYSLVERDTDEALFFSRGAWTGLPSRNIGIGKLRERLSRVLLGQVASELPSLMSEIEFKFKTCQAQLDKMGAPRQSPEEQRRYMIAMSQSFQRLVHAAVGGNYNDKFFDDPMTDAGYDQRIRAVIQNSSRDFASTMSRSGHYWEVGSGSEASKEDKNGTGGPQTITKDNFLAHIQKMLERTRGRELPGTFSPMIVANLFNTQSGPWKSISQNHIGAVWDSVWLFVRLVIAHIADASAARALEEEIFEPAMKKMRKDIDAKLGELLTPHQSGHPITYDHSFTEMLQKVRSERMPVGGVEKIITDFFSQSYLQDGNTHLNGYYNLARLARSLTIHNEPDMNRYAAIEAMDCLKAYYNVAMKRFVDDIAVQVIEDKLLSALDKIMEPLSVYEMSAEQVARIAGESEERRTEREELAKQLEVLRNGLETCKKFSGFRIVGDMAFLSLGSFRHSVQSVVSSDGEPIPDEVDEQAEI
ncbi:P-loop containing nucleoside triphosphate hydrolase protein [Cladorrhinum sp. PSN259]|nr:P-loop containing nucleoside triphosphate hydrolase protein [Cladorrhinum sp. PSN259]